MSEQINAGAVARREAARVQGRFGFQQFSEAAGGSSALGGPPNELSVDPEVESPELTALASAGLKGHVEAYNGRDADVPSDAVVYYPDQTSGQAFILGNLGAKDFIVYDDLDTDEAFRHESSEEWDAANAVKQISGSRFQRTVRDKMYNEFSWSEEFEFRDADMWKGEDGNLYAMVTLQDEEGGSVDVTYNYDQDELSASVESGGELDAEKIAASLVPEGTSPKDSFHTAALSVAKSGNVGPLAG